MLCMIINNNRDGLRCN